MKSMDELFFSQDSRDKYRQFQDALKSIGDKYKDFFKDKTTAFHTDREHAELDEYYIIKRSSDTGLVQFWFINDIVPDYIQRECKEAFNHIYNNQKQ